MEVIVLVILVSIREIRVVESAVTAASTTKFCTGEVPRSEIGTCEVREE